VISILYEIYSLLFEIFLVTIANSILP